MRPVAKAVSVCAGLAAILIALSLGLPGREAPTAEQPVASHAAAGQFGDRATEQFCLKQTSPDGVIMADSDACGAESHIEGQDTLGVTVESDDHVTTVTGYDL